MEDWHQSDSCIFHLTVAVPKIYKRYLQTGKILAINSSEMPKKTVKPHVVVTDRQGIV